MKRTGRGRGSRQRVDAARRQAATALGRDPDQRDLFIEPPKSSSSQRQTTSTGASSAVASHGIGVLSIGEAAARLGMSRTQFETLIDRGSVKALPSGFTRMIPTSEIERLQSTRGNS
jgi:excisionase family DNA binding protein